MNTHRVLMTSGLLSASAPGGVRGHALLIGVDQYSSPTVATFSGGVKDAQAMALAVEEALSIPRSNISLLTGEKATRAAVLDAIANLQKSAKPDEIVVFGFFGHSLLHGGEVSLLPFDAAGASKSELKASGLAAKELVSLLSKIPSRLLLTAYDTTRTGPLASAAEADNSATSLICASLTVPSRETGLGPQETSNFFAASRGTRSWAIPSTGRGVFATAFEEGLRGAALLDGAVSLGSLVNYLAMEVPLVALVEAGAKQEHAHESRGDGPEDLVLAPRPVGPLPKRSEFDRLMREGLDTLYAALPSDNLELPHAKARESFLKAAKANPKAPAPHLWVAMTYDISGDSVKAERALRSAVKASPADPLSLYRLASHKLEARGSSREAEKILRRLLKGGPFAGAAAEVLGDILAYQRGDLKGAKAMYRRAIFLDPNQPGPKVRLATLLVKEGMRDPEADRLLRAAVRNEPEDGDALVWLGAIQMYWSGAFDKAEKNFRLAAELMPLDADPIINLAKLLDTYWHDPEGALKVLDEAIEKGVEDPELDLHRGKILLEHRGDLAQAEESFREAMKKGPRMGDPCLQLGILYLDYKQDHVRAEPLLRRAIELEPSTPEPLVALARLVEFSKNDPAGADRLLKRAIKLDPENCDVLEALGDAAWRRGGKEKEAEKHFRAAVANAPWERRFGLRLVQFLLEGAKRPADAEAAARLHLEHHQFDPESWTVLGSILQRKGDLSGAESAFRKAIELEPEDSKPWLWLAGCLAGKMDIQGAEAEYRKALEVSPKDSYSHFMYGDFLERVKKDLPGAEARYREAIALSPAFAPAYLSLHRTLLAAEKGEEARKLKEQAAKSGFEIPA